MELSHKAFMIGVCSLKEASLDKQIFKNSVKAQAGKEDLVQDSRVRHSSHEGFYGSQFSDRVAEI